MSRFNWEAIPRPLQRQKRWGVYNADTKEVGFQPGTRSRFKANDITTAMSFEKARQYAEKLNASVGGEVYGPMYFVSHEYVVLDYDKTEDVDALALKLKCTAEEAALVKAKHYEMLRDMPTWTERSCSGSGYHSVYTTGDRGSATTKLTDLAIDVVGAGSLVFMTGDVANDNGGMLSLAGSFVAEVVQHAVDRKEFIREELTWCNEIVTDEQLFERYAAERPEQLAFLRTSQDQSGIGDQRFAALKDLIVRSMNYEQIERIYLGAPACSFENKSSNRGSTDKTPEGYANFLRREIDRAASELIRADQFSYLIKPSLECPIAPVSEERLNVGVEEERVKFPPLTGIGAKAQASLDQVKGCSPDLSLLSTLVLCATACGRNYVTRGLTSTGLNNSLSFLQIDYMVISGSGQGKSSAMERLAVFANHVPDNFHGIRSWWQQDKVQHVVPKSISAQSLHSKVSKQQNGMIIHLDEIGMLLEAVSAMGGFEGWINSLNNSRQVGMQLSAPDYSDSAKILPPIKEPIVSVVATGVPANTAIALRKQNRIESGYLSRHLMLVLSEEDRQKEVDLDAFSFDVVQEPVIRYEEAFLEWLEVVIAKRDQPVLVQWDPSVKAYLQRVFRVAHTDPMDNKTIPFNRYDDYTVKLSALQAVLKNPYNPVHTAETMAWAIEFTEAARGAAHAWFHSSVSTGTVRLAEREDIDTEALYGKIFTLVSNINGDRLKRTPAHTKLIEYLTRQRRTNFIKCIESGAVPIGYLKMRKNSLGLAKAGSTLNDVLERAIKEGVDDRRLKAVLVHDTKCVQALA